MFRPNGKWQKFNTKSEINLAAKQSQCRVRIVNWTSPGWYFITNYSQKCPRGCCYDDVIEFTHSTDRIYEIKEEMRNLADLLRSARMQERA